MTETPKTCTVQFRTGAGAWVHVTAGLSVFHAAAKALEFFNSPHWHGPRPRPETILEVGLIGSERVWGVLRGRVREYIGAGE